MKRTQRLLRLLILYVCTSLFSFFSFAQYSTLGPLSGSAFTDDNSTGDFPFNTPGSAIASDNVRSSASAILTLFQGNTHYLKVTGFGFSVPALAFVTGIKVEVEKSATGIILLASVKDNEIRLLKSGTPTGDNKADNTSWSGSDDYDSYGDTTDAWGTTWTPVEVNASDFGVIFSAEINGLATVFPSARVDHIRVTVFYVIPLPIHFLNFSAAIKNENKVLLEWTTADNDEKVLFTVQRSTDGSNWADIQNIPGDISYSKKRYQYVDNISAMNTRFYYRVKMTLLSRAVLYTKIVFTDINSQSSFNIYPNPAGNQVFIFCKDAQAVSLFSISGKRVPVSVDKISPYEVKINTSGLQPGLYIVQVNNKHKQLLIR